MQYQPMASQPSVNNENYDPKTDQVRKARSNDLGWKYGYWVNLENKDQVTCTLCGIRVCGGDKKVEATSGRWLWRCQNVCKDHYCNWKKDEWLLEGKQEKKAIVLGRYWEQEHEDDMVVVEANLAESIQVQSNAPASQASKMQLQPSSGIASKRRHAAYLFKALEKV